MDKEHRFCGWALVITAIFLIVLFLIPDDVHGDKGDLELRAYASIVPDPNKLVGGGVAWQFGVVQEGWFLIGGLLPGHGVFVDGLYVDGKGHLGGSISMLPMEKDNGLRVFGSAWWEGGAQWLGGLSQKIGEW